MLRLYRRRAAPVPVPLLGSRPLTAAADFPMALPTRQPAPRRQNAGLMPAHTEDDALGLRHSFGANAVQSNVPPHLVQRWLGHASLRTTSIYGDVIGPDERAFAERMWVKPCR
jgi:integrase